MEKETSISFSCLLEVYCISSYSNNAESIIKLFFTIIIIIHLYSCSSLMLSASNQVYQSLANLVRWSDNILLYGEKAVEKENVAEIVQAVHDAVKVITS